MTDTPGGTGAPLKPLGYQPALDGVRAVAIALVVLFHTDRGGHLPVLPGGFLGVDVFFVLSGFLITSLLLDERAGTGRIRMRAFWGRRVARLFPLLWALLAVNAFAAWASHRRPRSAIAARLPGPARLRGELGAGAWPRRSVRLGVRVVVVGGEQFYVVWPLVVAELLALAAGRRGPERSERSGSTAGQASTARTPPVSVAAVALGAAVLVMVLRPTVFAHTFFFFNTLLRADGLLLGAALAATRHLWQPRISPALSKLLIAAAALVIVVAVADTGNLDPSLPTWKLPALEVAVVVLGAALVAAPATSIGRLAGSEPAGLARSPLLRHLPGPLAVVRHPGSAAGRRPTQAAGRGRDTSRPAAGPPGPRALGAARPAQAAQSPSRRASPGGPRSYRS